MKLPKGWEVKRLGDLGDALIGLTYTPADVAEEGTRVLRSSNIQNGAIVYGDDVYVRGTVPPKCLVQPGDILICARNGSRDLIGKSATITPNQKGDAFGAFMAVYRSQEHRFIFQLLKTEAFRRQVSENLGATINSLTNSVLLRLSFLFPPEGEREKIADILGTWDEALEKLDALIAAKARRKQALMQQLLTGHRRLPGFSNPWAKSKLGELFLNRTENNRVDLPLLSITADQGVVSRGSLTKRDTSSEDKSKYLRIAPGDIGYNTMRMWQGVSALSTMEGIVSPAYTILTPTPRIDGKFAAHFFKLPHTISLFHRYSQGLVDDTLNLKFPAFAVIEVTVPVDVTEQRAIAAVLDTADAELRLLRQQRTALDHQKRGLMQQLLTGQIRVSTKSK